MTNLRKIFGTALLAATVIVLAGCKKDDDTTVKFYLSDYSLDFVYGQTKKITYTYQNITKYNDADIEVPAGWTCTRTKGVFTITAPSQSNSSAELKGTIKVSAQTNTDATLTRSITVSVKIADEITRKANSFIVSEPGHRYKFNARRRGNESTETLSKASKSLFLWSTSDDAIINVSYEEGYIYFATADGDELREANALVAVTDDDDNVLWSWHIWATNYDPATEFDLYGGEMVMNRNLGALRNSNASPEDAVLSYGLYYQWGRKDPFAGPDAWNSTIQQPLYTTVGSSVVHLYEVSDKEVGTLEYSIANPGTFIAGTEKSDFDWLYAARNNSLWTSSATGGKSLYDPCPDGWRVAPPIWTSFTTTGTASSDPLEFNVEGGYEYGWTFYGDDDAPVFYPAAGRRSFSPSLATTTKNFTNVVNDVDGVGYPVGFYWSSTAPASDALSTTASSAAARFAFRRDYVNPDSSSSASADKGGAEGPRAGGFPLRCVAVKSR